MITADDIRPYRCDGALWCQRHKRQDDAAAPHTVAAIAGKLLSCPTASITRVSRADPIFRRARGLCDQPLRPTTLAAAVLFNGKTLLVSDARVDPRFSGLLQVAMFPFARFFAGVPLLGENGDTVGALTLIDYRPRALPSAAEMACVENLAETIGAMMGAADPRAEGPAPVPHACGTPPELHALTRSNVAHRSAEHTM